MKRLRNNGVFKAFMIALFMLSMLICAASGVLTIKLYSKHALTKRGKETFKNSIITNIAYDQYNWRAVEYYREYLMGYDDYSKDANYFSEENTNYSFHARVLDGYVDYPELVTYEPSSYQYSQTDKYSINVDTFEERKEIRVSSESIFSTTPYVLCTEEDLVNLGWYDYGYEEKKSESIYRLSYEVSLVDADVINDLEEKFYYNNGYYYFEEKNNNKINDEINNDYSVTVAENDGGGLYLENVDMEDIYNCYDGYSDIYSDVMASVHMVTDGNYYYVLENISSVSDCMNSIRNTYSDAEIYFETWYASEKGYLYIAAFIYPTLEVELNWYIKDDLTAYDTFYNSLELRYIDDVNTFSIPVCVISAIIMFISFAFLIITAGHRRVKRENEDGTYEISDELKLGIFDKLPYDLMFIILLVTFAFGVENLSNAYYGSIESVIAVVCAVLTSFFAAYLVMTTAARLKCEGWSFFKNTVTYKLAGLLIKVLKRAFKWLGSGITYMWKHLNLYWKYLLILIGVGFVELLFTLRENAPFTFGLLIIEKIVILALAAYAVINITKIKNYTKSLAEGNTDDELSTEHMYGEFLEYAKDLGHVNDGIKAAVENQMKSEMMKTELITNVSHDIKTPLTSIINYVDLLEKENIDNDKAKEYLEVLNRHSQRLKKLIIDLIDASKASTGNVDVNLEKLDLSIILTQLNGEYEEQFEEKKLKLVVSNKASDTHIMADGRQIYRVFDNLFINIKKYAQDNTRVYIDITDEGDKLGVSMKNISKEELNITGEELMERFTRGDRSRNTEGSGLGLSIAKSLIELQNGMIKIMVDGDLFKVELLIPKA